MKERMSHIQLGKCFNDLERTCLKGFDLKCGVLFPWTIGISTGHSLNFWWKLLFVSVGTYGIYRCSEGRFIMVENKKGWKQQIIINFTKRFLIKKHVQNYLFFLLTPLYYFSQNNWFYQQTKNNQKHVRAWACVRKIICWDINWFYQ